MPDAIAQQQDHYAGDDAPAMRQVMASLFLMDRRGLAGMVLGAAGNLLLEALDILIGIQTQMTRIRTQKPDRIGLAGEVFQPVFLQRLQMVLADLQGAGNLRDLVAPPQTRGAQIPSYR